jgi:hypothetical protein
MRRAGAWKLSKRAMGAASALGLLAALPGCVVVPAGLGGGYAPPGSDKIVAGCVWPGFGRRVTYGTASGDLYQVEVYGNFAREQASLMGGNFIVHASYNDLFWPPVTINVVTTFNSRAAPPSQAALETGYAFGAAARMAIAGFSGLAPLPSEACPPTLEVDGIRRADPSALFFAPRPY